MVERRGRNHRSGRHMGDRTNRVDRIHAILAGLQQPDVQPLDVVEQLGNGPVDPKKKLERAVSFLPGVTVHHLAGETSEAHYGADMLLAFREDGSGVDAIALFVRSSADGVARVEQQLMEPVRHSGYETLEQWSYAQGVHIMEVGQEDRPPKLREALLRAKERMADFRRQRR